MIYNSLTVYKGKIIQFEHVDGIEGIILSIRNESDRELLGACESIKEAKDLIDLGLFD